MQQIRPPIVTVLGHVDHGKTTLLDVIRKTNVASRETGGITQRIGASQISTQNGVITFIDTPGHAAFSQMRSRGAKVADIVILVVAADDGVKPQTREAIQYIKEAEIPYIVALTKTDLPSANPEKAMAELEQEGILFEGRGGDTPRVLISAKNNTGIDALIEMIELLAGINEISADPDSPLEAIVIETNKDNRGPVVSVVVRNGTLKTGQEVWVDGMSAKIRGLFDDKNKTTQKVLPGEAALIMGFSQLPQIGSQLRDLSSTDNTRVSKKNEGPISTDGKIPLVIKAQSAGVLEALMASLPEGVVVVSSGVGDVTESDVFFAKTAKAHILLFEVKVTGSVAKLAETEGIKIEKFSIIYELLDRVNDIVKASQDEVLGKAEVLDIFPYENKKVAGCKIKEGKISINDKLIINRGETVLGEAKAVSLKRGKQDITEAKAGEECGILFVPQLDFARGDVILSVKR